MKNGQAQTMTCSANSSATAGTFAANACTDTTHTVTAVAGDLVSFRFVQNNSAPAVRVGVGVRCQ
jgi:hypothetical protein